MDEFALIGVRTMPPPIKDQKCLLPEWSAQLETRSGLKLNVRPAAQDDESELIQLLRQASPEDLRYRFLSAVGKPGHSLAQPMVEIDHTRTENLLAFDASDGRLAATAMIAADEKLEDAEVAILVRQDLKGHGVGWAMLAQSCDYARKRGIQKIHSVELTDNRSAISLEKEMGFIARPYPGDATLTMLSKDLGT